MMVKALRMEIFLNKKILFVPWLSVV